MSHRHTNANPDVTNQVVLVVWVTKHKSHEINTDMN